MRAFLDATAQQQADTARIALITARAAQADKKGFNKVLEAFKHG